MFGGGINKELVKSMLGTMPRRDQTQVLQDLYNKGYTVPGAAAALRTAMSPRNRSASKACNG